MSVYDLDMKGLRKTFQEFHKTLYGKTVFFLAYIIPAMLFASAMISMAMVSYEMSAILLGIFVVAFILGNIYFYTEIRKFTDTKEHSKKRHSSKKKK